MLLFSHHIERLFRFIEMVGVTVLLKVVLKPVSTEFAEWIIVLLGALLASTYLLEPLNHWAIQKALKTEAYKRNERLTVFALCATFGVLTGLLFVVIAKLADLMTIIVAN